MDTRRQISSQGITLIEVMLIAVVLAIVTAIVFRIYLIRSAAHSPNKTSQAILAIENGMKLYKLDNGFYPTTEQGIPALVIKPITKPIPQHWTNYLKTLPKDACGKPFQYENPGRHGEVDIYSNCRSYTP